MTLTSTEVTQLLMRLRDGDDQAAADLLRTLYSDLRRVAAVRLADERTAHTFQPTDLVNEAYLRLVKADEVPNWNSRGHFFTAAAEAMRRILIDHARRRNSQKRGGDRGHVDLPDELIPDERKAIQLLSLEEALTSFEEQDPKKAELVKLRFFGGMTIEQAAEVLEISTTTADRYWAYSRAWLKTEMGDEQ